METEREGERQRDRERGRERDRERGVLMTKVKRKHDEQADNKIKKGGIGDEKRS